MKLRGAESYRAAVLPWMGLAVPRFKCGHEKTPANTYSYDNKNRHGNTKRRTRCKTCARKGRTT